jgi:hypothetical protein
MQTEFESQKRKGSYHLGDLGVEDRIILKWILRKKVDRTELN